MSILRYSLCVPNEHSNSIIRQLHMFASEQMFRHISPIMSFSGDDCKIEKDDSAAVMKLDAQGIAVANGRVLSFLPLKFSAFGCQLPNKRLMFIGFSEYPSVVKTPSGQKFSTLWNGKSHWHSTSCPFDSRFIDSDDDCDESHRVACNLLMYADDLKVLRCVEDTSGAYHFPNCFDIRTEGPLKPLNS